MLLLLYIMHLNLHNSKNYEIQKLYVSIWNTELYVFVHEATYIYGRKYMQNFYCRRARCQNISATRWYILTMVIYGSPVYWNKAEGLHFQKQCPHSLPKLIIFRVFQIIDICLILTVLVVGFSYNHMLIKQSYLSKRIAVWRLIPSHIMGKSSYWWFTKNAIHTLALELSPGTTYHCEGHLAYLL